MKMGLGKAGVWLLVVTGILAAGAGWLFTRVVLESEPAQVAVPDSPAAESLIGKSRPDFTLGSATGERVSAADFDGRVVLLNFWATWCEPCREEMPMLSSLSEEFSDRGVQIVGIALDDVQQARDFLQELGIEYTNLVGTVDVMALSRAYGNQAGLLPFSVLIDQEGIVRQTWLGVLNEAELREAFESLS